MVIDFIKNQQQLNILNSNHNHNSPALLTPTGPPALGIPDPYQAIFKFSKKSIDKVQKKLQNNSTNLDNWEKIVSYCVSNKCQDYFPNPYNEIDLIWHHW